MHHFRIAGFDGPGKRALPAGEFLNAPALAAFLTLALNDWWLKPSSWAPGWLTGKLSDVAGLLFFPLLLTALFDCAALGLHRLAVRHLGRGVDFTLRRYKIALAIAITALVFALAKLDPSSSALVENALRTLGLSARIVVDRSDLCALVVLFIPWRIANAEIARMPLGRLEYLEWQQHLGSKNLGSLLSDLVRAGQDPALVADLVHALEESQKRHGSAGDARVKDCLGRLRGTTRSLP